MKKLRKSLKLFCRLLYIIHAPIQFISWKCVQFPTQRGDVTSSCMLYHYVLHTSANKLDQLEPSQSADVPFTTCHHVQDEANAQLLKSEGKFFRHPLLLSSRQAHCGGNGRLVPSQLCQSAIVHHFKAKKPVFLSSENLCPVSEAARASSSHLRPLRKLLVQSYQCPINFGQLGDHLRKKVKKVCY